MPQLKDNQIREENIKRRGEIYHRHSKVNKEKYREVYREFFNRGGPEWYAALTGRLMDKDRMFADIGYFKTCLYEGLEAEGFLAKEDPEYSHDYFVTTKDRGETSEDKFRKTMRFMGFGSTGCRDLSKREMLIIQGTPCWANIDKIKAIYKERERLTSETGIPYAVDHIVPVIHERVCGLNVEFNLQVITAEENARKSNKFNIG